MTFPTPAFREVLTRLDAGEAELILTDDAEAAMWARAHGYRVEVAEQSGHAVYEIYPGDSGPASV